MTKKEFRSLLKSVDRSYDDFVAGVMSYIALPGNTQKAHLIADFITGNPTVNSADVLKFMIDETDFCDSLDQNYADSSAVSFAMKMIQQGMIGEGEKAQLETEDDIDALVAEVRAETEMDLQ